MVYDHLKDLQCKMELTMQAGEIFSTSNATIKAWMFSKIMNFALQMRVQGISFNFMILKG